jgi:cytochrome c biogenesis protein CcmG/thiol:disulfide interchange protein DsbE
MTMAFVRLRLLPGLLLAVLMAGCHKQGGLEIGDPAPSVNLADFHGNTVKLPDDFKGKIVLVRFWSIDCGFCDKNIMEALEHFHQKYKNRRFLPVAVNVSRVEANDERFKRFRHLSYPMLIDEYGLAARQFGVIGLPATFVIDEKGILRAKMSGEAGLEELEKFFTTVLNKGDFYEGYF